MTLYDITEDYLRLLELAEDPEVDQEVIADTLEAIEGELEVKAENAARVIRQLEADADALKKEADRFTKRQKAAENSIKRLKSLLQYSMEATGKVKFETEHFKFRIQKNPPALKLADDIDFANIPAEYIKFAEPEIDKAAVKAALKQGAEFSWARMESSESVRF